MNHSRRLVFAAILSLTTGLRAVSPEAALFAAPQKARPQAMRVSVPRAAHFREVTGRGLIASVWINSSGPFNFVIDTGAGATLVSPRVGVDARLELRNSRTRSISGLSGAATAAHTAGIQSIAIGDRANFLPNQTDVLVTSGLPRDIDGVLDPTEAFSPLGYVIDIPRGELTAFDPREMPLSVNNQPEEGAVVAWLRDRHGRRPFVELDNGDRALIDTGSTLGLAIRDTAATPSRDGAHVRDVGGGRISTRRGRPITVAIGALMLRNVPTDLVSGINPDAPVLLGLSALRPFRLAFDPMHRLIEIAPRTRGQSR